MGIFGLVKGLT